MPSQRRRPTLILATLAVMAAAGAGAFGAARLAAAEIERRSAEAVTAVLAAQPWAAVEADGLQLRLTGTAPDEVARFRAVELAGSVVDPRRVVDGIAVAQGQAAPTPAFGIELLRNDGGVSLIGLVPAATDRAALLARLGQATGAKVADLLQAADHPAPEGWDAALDYGLRVAETTPRAKISIAPGKVSVTAITDSPQDKARLETDLARGHPPGVTVATEISTPRPVIAPFTLRFVMDAKGARFDACAADSEAARDRILAAATAAGATGTLGCTLGLGAPTAEWADAAVPAIAALAALKAGTVTLSDADIALDVPASVPRAEFDVAVARLQAALPDVFALTATLEKAETPNAAPTEFTAARQADGSVTLRGRVADERMREAVESLARARFPSVDSALLVDPSVPAGWTLRTIAAVEALAALANGKVEVTPDLVRVDGLSGNARASDEAAATLARRLGAGARYALAIRYERRLDPALGLPDGQTCVDRANAAMARAEIGFAPAKAEFEGEVEPTLAALKTALAECGDFRIEVGGHTDAQGSDDFNARLSAGRAEAVLAALAAEGVVTANMTAKGYGESVPVADNDSEAGREANRRIEFRLLSPDPVTAAAPTVAPVVAGVTTEPAATPTPSALPLPTPEVPAALQATPAPAPSSGATTGAAPATGTTTAPATEPVAEAPAADYTGAAPGRPPARPAP